MKIILSRKGFDRANGGCASPIFEDGTLLSMPIPADSSLKFSEIKYKDWTYEEIWKQLKPKSYKIENACCHLDPDIRCGVRINEVVDWIPAFGQIDSAQSHLEDEGVTIGDVFLFFGWFRNVENINGVLKYKRCSRDLQLIYGYMQIGKILKNDEVEKLTWHPHSNINYRIKNKNTIYIPSNRLTINGEELNLPGYGVLKYSDDVVLTKDGCSRSRWKIIPWMKKTKITYHTGEKFGVDLKNDYFQSVPRGQEFVVYENNEAIEWMKKLIINNY
jgi:hypothetical protein